MKTTIKEITPQWAARVLETRNPRNRKISDTYVQRLTTDIVNGAYLKTHEAIAFDENGDLIDGQHRLMAVIRSNRSIESVVTTDVPCAQKVNGTMVHTFSVIDTGRARKPGQMLQIEGYKNANAICAAARVLFQMCSATPETFVGISAATAKLVLCATGRSIEQVTALARAGKIFRANTACIAAISFWHTADPVSAESFVSELCEVTGKTGCVTRNLAGWANRHPQSGGCCACYHFQATANAIEQLVTNKNLGRIYTSPSSVAWLLSQNRKLADKISSLAPHCIQ